MGSGTAGLPVKNSPKGVAFLVPGLNQGAGASILSIKCMSAERAGARAFVQGPGELACMLQQTRLTRLTRDQIHVALTRSTCSRSLPRAMQARVTRGRAAQPAMQASAS